MADNPQGMDVKHLPDGDIEVTIDLKHPNVDANIEQIMGMIGDHADELAPLDAVNCPECGDELPGPARPEGYKPSVWECPKCSARVEDDVALAIIAPHTSAMLQEHPVRDTFASLLREGPAGAERLQVKVDNMQIAIKRMKHEEEWCRQQAQPFLDAAGTLKRQGERLKSYILYNMSQAGTEILEGNTYRLELADNQPALDITQREANALDLQKYPQFCEQIRFYQWKTEEVKAALVAERKAAAESGNLVDSRQFAVQSMPFARLTIGQQIKFPLNIPGKQPAKKKARKK